MWYVILLLCSICNISFSMEFIIKEERSYDHPTSGPSITTVLKEQPEDDSATIKESIFKYYEDKPQYGMLLRILKAAKEIPASKSNGIIIHACYDSTLTVIHTDDPNFKRREFVADEYDTIDPHAKIVMCSTLLLKQKLPHNDKPTDFLRASTIGSTNGLHEINIELNNASTCDNYESHSYLDPVPDNVTAMRPINEEATALFFTDKKGNNRVAFAFIFNREANDSSNPRSIVISSLKGVTGIGAIKRHTDHQLPDKIRVYRQGNRIVSKALDYEYRLGPIDQISEIEDNDKCTIS